MVLAYIFLKIQAGSKLWLEGRHEIRLPLVPPLDPGEGAGSPGLFFWGGGAEADGEKGTDWNGTEIP